MWGQVRQGRQVGGGVPAVMVFTNRGWRGRVPGGVDAPHFQWLHLPRVARLVGRVRLDCYACAVYRLLHHAHL